jgi:competence protein ComEA
MAAKIVEYRGQIGGRFTSLEQLMDVKGVGEKTFAKWQPFLTLK